MCGLKWSPWGTQLASGGNDNLLNVWDDRYVSSQNTTTDQPLFRLDAHQARACYLLTTPTYHKQMHKCMCSPHLLV